MQKEWPWVVVEMVERIASSGIAGSNVITNKESSSNLHSCNN